MPSISSMLGGPTLDDALTLVWPAELPDHLSASSLTMYHRCREQYRQRYVEQRKEPPKGYFLWGKADHSAIEGNFRHKITTGEDLPVPDVQEIFSATLDALVDAANEVEWEGSSQAETKDRGVPLVTAYRTQVAPSVQPITVEEKFSIEVPGAPVPVIGYIDLRHIGGITDRKTKGKKVSKPSGDWLAQGRVYQLAHADPVSWHVSVKTKTPAVYTQVEEQGLWVAHDPAEDEKTRSWVRSTARAIMSDYLMFGPDGPWPGSHTLSQPPCGWCGFRRFCAWQKGLAREVRGAPWEKTA